MSKGLRILQGGFGRVALLDMDQPLVEHAHEHCHVLIKAGGDDTYFRVRDRLVPLTDETAVLVNSWEPHTYWHVAGAPNAVILALYIEPAWLGTISRALQASGHPRFFPDPCARIDVQISRPVATLVDCLLHGTEISTAEIEELVFDVMISTISRFSDWKDLGGQSANLQHASDFRIRRALAYARDNICLSLEPGELSRVAGLSRAHFFQRFRDCVGVTPRMYLNVLRMEQAHRLITRSQLDIGSISAELGFPAQSHFTRFFKHHQGLAPTSFRRVTEVVGPGRSPA